MDITPSFYNGIELDQGRYKLEVSKQGYKSKTQWVTINSNQGIDLYVELEKLAISPSSGNSGGRVTAGQTPGQTWTEPVTGMEFVWVPQGCYQMGSNSGAAYNKEKPVHEVCLDGFWMAKYEVTQGQWKKIMGNNPSKFKSGDNYPVETVFWNDAKKFISRLNQQSGKTFKLPIEAQWEYAARSGGKDQKYSGGNDADSVAWSNSNSGGKHHRVGTKAPNGLGIYDMSGNVGEWCEDFYDRLAYSQHSRNNPVITSGGSSRVLRGGNWYENPRDVRATVRSRSSADFRFSYWGSGSAFLKSAKERAVRTGTEAVGRDEPVLERVGAAEVRFIMYRMPVEIFK